MGSEPRGQRQPGGPAGIAEVVAKEFNAPTTPTLTRADALERLHPVLMKKGLTHARISLSSAPVRPGELINGVGERVPFPASAHGRCFIALINPEPLARWAHDAWWAFIPADGKDDIELVPTRWPAQRSDLVRFDPASQESGSGHTI